MISTDKYSAQRIPGNKPLSKKYKLAHTPRSSEQERYMFRTLKTPQISIHILMGSLMLSFSSSWKMVRLWELTPKLHCRRTLIPAKRFHFCSTLSRRNSIRFLLMEIVVLFFMTITTWWWGTHNCALSSMCRKCTATSEWGWGSSILVRTVWRISWDKNRRRLLSQTFKFTKCYFWSSEWFWSKIYLSYIIFCELWIKNY